MDVHPPHEPIHTWRDFFIHLITITIGLFIALMLEALVEWRHHRHLVHVAETNLRREIQDNRKELEDALASLPTTEREMQKNLTTLRNVRDQRPQTVHSMTLAFAAPSLKQAAWNTARDTGALSYMPYATAERYSDLYTLQGFVQGMDTELVNAEARALAAVTIEGDPLKMNPGQAETALAEVAEVQARLVILKGLAQQLQKAYAEELQGNRNP